MRNFLILMLAFILAFIGLTSLSQPANAGSNLQGDINSQGRYIATIAGCTSCHTPYKAEYQNPQNLTLEQIQTIAFDETAAIDVDKFLAGGRPFDLGPAGVVYTRNLTSDDETGIGTWTDEQVKIAIKTGLDINGKTLFPVMPYHVYNGMADADLDAVVSFIRSVNIVSNKVPEKTVNTEGMPTLPYTNGIIAPEGTDKAARGAYLVNSVMGCADCHTPVDPATGAALMDKHLGGRQPYEGPWGIVYGGNITPDTETGIGDWTEEEIKRALVAGIAKDGRRLILMPWYVYSSLTQEDADAVVFYLKNVLPAVNNEVPAASLNPDFMVMAPGINPEDTNPAISPFMWVVVGILIIVLIFVGVFFLRRRTR